MSSAQRRFGTRLRRMRMDAGVTLGSLARHLQVQLPYLSAVETGKRPPLSTERIASAAELIASVGEIDKEAIARELLAAAAAARGAFELSATSVSAEAKALGVDLVRLWPHLSRNGLRAIHAVLRREGGDHGSEEDE